MSSPDVSTVLQSLISNNSELSSRLLSLLLVNSGSGEEIIRAINSGSAVTELDAALLRSLDVGGASAAAVVQAATAAASAKQPQNDSQSDPVAEELRREEKRRRNTEASARFRKRRREREQEKTLRLRTLQQQIAKLNDRIGALVDENAYWKRELKRINESKSEKLLKDIRQRASGAS
ncbi:hypothetical protein DAKH74_024320 [Maudiozyma humilis]|uniref:BZIP domain-containing protein n=1 Tax=Maudiozyma humilis TaxID=51915 RepID=A0AAV5RWK9_MAUHU|nr:hypothetical protein DAKH74_024320 [Kazachstania humilis]